MKTLTWILPLIVLLMFSSCRKDQRKVNRMEGKWSVVWAKLPNFGKVEPDLIFKFDWCKIRFDDFCDFSVYNFKLDESEFGIYSVSNDGNAVTISFEESGYNHFEVFSIERLNFRTLKLKNTNSQSMYYSELRLRSID